MAEILVQPMLAILLFAQASPNAKDLLGWEDSMQLARQQAETGKYAEAEKTLKRVLVKSNDFGPNHIKRALLLNDLALTQQQSGKYLDAERNYRLALGIAERAEGAEGSTSRTDRGAAVSMIGCS